MANPIFKLSVALGALALLGGAPILHSQAVAAQRTVEVFNPDKLVWTAVGAPFPPGAFAAPMEGNPDEPGAYTIRFKCPAGYTIAPHWHPDDEHVTVIQGEMYIAMGSKVGDRSHMMRVAPGGFTLVPNHEAHYAIVGDMETILQIHGVGPWGITFVDEHGKDIKP